MFLLQIYIEIKHLYSIDKGKKRFTLTCVLAYQVLIGQSSAGGMSVSRPRGVNTFARYYSILRDR